MANKSEVKLDMTISATDKFSTSFAKFASKFDGLQKKFSKFSSKVSPALGKVNDSFSKLSEKVSAFGGVLGGVTAVGVGLASGLVGLAVSVSNTTKEIDRFSRFAGVSNKTMQELAYAGNQVGLETEELAMQMAALAERQVEAANGNEEFQEIFKAMNVDLKDGQGRLRSTDDILGQLADTFSKMEEGPTKSTVAIKLFGDAGSKLLPMLDRGAAGIDEMRAEAVALGVVMSDQAIQESNNFGSSLAKLMDQLKAVGQNLATSFMPAILKVTEAFSGWINKNRELIAGKITEWATAFSNSIPAIVSGIESFFSGVATLISHLSSLVEWVGGVQNFLVMLGALFAGPLVMAVGGFVKALVVLAVATGPVGIAILAISAAIGAVIAFFPEAWTAFKAFGQRIQKFFSDLIPDWVLEFFGVSTDTELQVKTDVDMTELDKLEKRLEEEKKLGVDAPTNYNPFMGDYNFEESGKNIDYEMPSGDMDDYQKQIDALNNSKPKTSSVPTAPTPTSIGGGSLLAPPVAMPASMGQNAMVTQSITETKIEDFRIKIILPPGVTAVGAENSSKVQVDTSSLGMQTGW